MFTREQQKQIPVGIRNFRGPAGLPLPPLPSDRCHSHERGSLAGGQTGRFSSGLDGSGISHTATHPVGTGNTSLVLRTPNDSGIFPRSFVSSHWRTPHTRATLRRVRLSALPSGSTLRHAFEVIAFIFCSSKIGLRNAALCESLYPLDIDCQGAGAIFLRANK